ncbi:MAG: MFS transporter [Parvularcula sp.]
MIRTPRSNPLPPILAWTPPRAYTAVYLGQYLFLGVYLPFFPGWLDEHGFSEQAIGLIGGGALILRLLLAPPIAYRAESLADPRTGLRFAAAAMAIVTMALLVPLPGFLVAILATIMWFSFGVLVPLTDSAVMRADRRGELNYGAIRGIGSASFVLASLAGGAVIAMFGENASVYWMAVAAGGGWLASLVLPNERARSGPPRAKPNRAFALGLFRSRSFVLMVLASGLTQGAHATYYAFSELHWSALGYSSVTIGMLWAFGVVCEVALLFAIRQVTGRFQPTQLILAGALAAAIRWPLTGLSPPLGLLFILQALHSLTFAATYVGTLEFIDRAVPAAYRTTAIAINSAFGVGAMTGLATIFIGGIFNRDAPFPAYAIMGAMGGIAAILTVWLRRRWDGGVLKAVPEDEVAAR